MRRSRRGGRAPATPTTPTAAGGWRGRPPCAMAARAVLEAVLDHFLYRDGQLFAKDVPVAEIAASRDAGLTELMVFLSKKEATPHNETPRGNQG